MSKREPQFNLRLSAELKSMIDDAAKENNRSINSEIVYRLQQSFEASNQQGNVDVFNGMQFKNLKLSMDKSSADKFGELLIQIANVIQDRSESEAGDSSNDYDLSASKDMPGYGDFK